MAASGGAHIGQPIGNGLHPARGEYATRRGAIDEEWAPERVWIGDRRARRGGRGECGRRSEETNDERDEGGGERRPANQVRKLQSLLPTKFSGVAVAIATACAITLGQCRPPTIASSISRLNRNATPLTTKNRAAWNPA